MLQDSLTPLHCAARSGHDLVVDALLEKGALATSKTKNGLTPLHMSSQGDHTECARILLFHKAPIDEVTMVCVGRIQGLLDINLFYQLMLYI